jgi:pimeloyl-ACP methyl ester carboxylesterase
LSWLEKPDLTERLSEIVVPTLVLCGDEDVRMDMAHLDQMTANLQNAELVKIPKAGHSSNLENPEYTNRAIERFLHRVYG